MSNYYLSVNKKRSVIFYTILANITLLLAIYSCIATDFFVRPEEGEYSSEDGLNYDTAFDGWSAIKWGNDKNAVGPGDTLFLCGLFTKEYINISAKGLPDQRIFIRGDNQIEPGIIDAEGLSKAIRLEGTEYLFIIGLQIKGAKYDGIGCIGSCKNLTIVNVTSMQNKGNGFTLLGHDLVLKNVKALNNSCSGIRIGRSNNAIVSDCIVSGNGTVDQNHDGIFIGNGSKDFLVDSTIVENQLGQSSFDVSNSPKDKGVTIGTFSNCIAMNGPQYGFHSALKLKQKTVIRYEKCISIGHKHNFQAGLFNEAEAIFINCEGRDGTETAGWAIEGSGIRFITIENAVVYGQKSKYLMKIGESKGLHLNEKNNKWYDGFSGIFVKIDGRLYSWEQWNTKTFKLIISEDSIYTKKY